ncbi:MAG: DNA gyrase subunit A, partial [Bacteroidetes bacterium]|nr:DNA gyrase subunit A [Bacteroidota bacterium]
GALVSIKNVTDGDDLMIITEAGVTIRLSVDEIRMTGRAAQGVKLINLREDDSIASVARVEITEIDEIEDEIIDGIEENEDENLNEDNLN